MKVFLLQLIVLLTFWSYSQSHEVSSMDSIKKIVEFLHFPDNGNLKIERLEYNSVDSSINSYFNLSASVRRYYSLSYTFSGFPALLKWYQLDSSIFVDKASFILFKKVSQNEDFVFDQNRIKNQISQSNIGIKKILFKETCFGSYKDEWFGSKKDFRLVLRLVETKGTDHNIVNLNSLGELKIEQTDEIDTKDYIAMLVFSSLVSDLPNSLKQERKIYFDLNEQVMRSCEISSPLQFIVRH